MQYPIGKVAKAFGLTKETLRYYERSGVMPSRREENGYRFYEKRQLQNMAVIRRMQNIGFSLKEISALMTDYSGERLFDKLEESIRVKEEELRYQTALLEKLREERREDMGGFGGEGETLILNADHPLVQYVTEHKEGENVEIICRQLYDLAKIQNAPLTAEDMAKFIARSNEIMMLLANK